MKNKDKVTYTLEIDGEIRKLETKLQTLKTQLDGILNSKKAPKGLVEAFSKIEHNLERISEKASQPISSSTFDSVTKAIGRTDAAMATIAKKLESVKELSEDAKIDFLPADLKAQVEAIVKATDNFSSAIKRAEVETENLTKARKNLQQVEEDVAELSARVAQEETWKKSSQDKIQSIKDEINAIEARSAALKEAIAEQKKVEEFYSSPDENGGKRDKRKKYEGVSMRPQEAREKVAVAQKGIPETDKSRLTELKTSLSEEEKGLKRKEEQLNRTTQSLEKYEIAQKSLKETVENLEKQFNTDSEKAKQAAFEKLREEATKLGISLDGVDTKHSEEAAADLTSRLQALKNKGINQVTQTVKKANTSLRENGVALDELGVQVDNCKDKYEDFTERTKQAEALQQRIKDFLGVAGAAQVMRQAMQDALQTISELDSTMTEMSVVTDLTVGDYWDQLPQYAEQASSLGVSINSAYKAATLYYQQGPQKFDTDEIFWYNINKGKKNSLKY